MVDALERLRLEDLPQVPRRGYWELLHQMRADLWRAQARVHELEVALGAREPGRVASTEGHGDARRADRSQATRAIGKSPSARRRATPGDEPTSRTTGQSRANT
jgi:hypothetical protein